MGKASNLPGTPFPIRLASHVFLKPLILLSASGSQPTDLG